MKVPKVFEFLWVHEDVWEEHFFLSFFVQEGVIHSAYGYFRAEIAQELHPLKDHFVVVCQITWFHQSTKMLICYKLTQSGT